MNRLVLTTSLTVLLFPMPGASQVPDDCETVRISDIGWTDNQAINGFATLMLEGLGYEPEVSLLSMPVALQSMKADEVDVHLDFWTPGADALTDPYLEDGSVEKVRTNLTGAQYTLAVPAYVHEAGLRDFADIVAFEEELDGRLYGIEPGNDGNAAILEMIEANAFGLGDFELVASSEQGMLAQLSRMERDGEWIVFLGWSPHPMNDAHDIRYLTGGEDWFGTGSSGWTAAREGYLEECPNVGRLLQNLSFDLDVMNKTMGYILNDGLSGQEAALKYVRDNPTVIEPWLEGVTTTDGDTGLDAVREHLSGL